MSSCPVILLDGPFSMVDQGYQQALEWADYALQTTYDAMEDLAQTPIPVMAVNSQLNPMTAWWTYRRPTKPARPDTEFDPDTDLISAPPSTDLAPVSFTAAPTFDGQAPLMPNRPDPGPLTAVAPTPTGDLPVPTRPTAPVIVIPEFPELREIVLPDVPNVVLPVFQGERPDLSGLEPPDVAFSFTPEQYNSALLDKTRGRISSMLDGGTGLPLVIAQALRDRAFASQDIQETRAVQQAIEEFGSRGFSEPNGILTRRISEVRQTAQNARSALNRDIHIQDQQIAVENLRFAVGQGVALESMLIAAHFQYMQLSLDAAKTAVQVIIDLHNTRIAVANLQLQQYQTDAQVHRDLIQAELAKIEVYKAQLEGQRLIGELNQQDVAIYEQRVRTVLAHVEIYNSQINAMRAEIEANNSIFEGDRVRVMAYAERVKAYGIEWDAYKAKIEADTAKMRNYEISANVFGTRVRAWAEGNNNLIAQARLGIAGKELDLNAWRAQIERIDSAIRAEVARIESITRIHMGDVEMYRADASIEQVASESNERVSRLAIEQEKDRVLMALENTRVGVSQLQEATKLAITKKSSIMQVGGQLSAASMSAVNFSAGVSSSQSQGQSCSTSFSYSGEIATE